MVWHYDLRLYYTSRLGNKRLFLQTALVTPTGAFAALKENQRFSDPNGFSSIVGVHAKDTPKKVCLLVVTPTGLEPMIPP